MKISVKILSLVSHKHIVSDQSETIHCCLYDMCAIFQVLTAHWRGRLPVKNSEDFGLCSSYISIVWVMLRNKILSCSTEKKRGFEMA